MIGIVRSQDPKILQSPKNSTFTGTNFTLLQTLAWVFCLWDIDMHFFKLMQLIVMLALALSIWWYLWILFGLQLLQHWLFFLVCLFNSTRRTSFKIDIISRFHLGQIFFQTRDRDRILDLIFRQGSRSNIFLKVGSRSDRRSYFLAEIEIGS